MKEILKNLFYFFIGIIFCLSIMLFISATWKPVTGSLNNSAVSICCSNDGNIVYVTDFDGVKKSSDGGKSWETVLSK